MDVQYNKGSSNIQHSYASHMLDEWLQKLNIPSDHPQIDIIKSAFYGGVRYGFANSYEGNNGECIGNSYYDNVINIHKDLLEDDVNWMIIFGDN